MSIIDREQEEVRIPTSLGDTKVVLLHISVDPETQQEVRSVKLDFTVLDQNGNEMCHRRPVITDRLIDEHPQQVQQLNQWVNWLWSMVKDEVLPE